jgi:hypothetical protein
MEPGKYRVGKVPCPVTNFKVAAISLRIDLCVFENVYLTLSILTFNVDRDQELFSRNFEVVI